MNKKLIVSITLLLVSAFLLTACGSAEKLTVYEFGDDKVPSINAVIGETRKVSGVSVGTDNGVQYKQYTYTSSTVTDDLSTYITFLLDEGWVATKDYDLSAVSGETQFAMESVDDGQVLIISMAFEAGQYTIRANKAEGELTFD